MIHSHNDSFPNRSAQQVDHKHVGRHLLRHFNLDLGAKGPHGFLVRRYHGFVDLAQVELGQSWLECLPARFERKGRQDSSAILVPRNDELQKPLGDTGYVASRCDASR